MEKFDYLYSILVTEKNKRKPFFNEDDYKLELGVKVALDIQDYINDKFHFNLNSTQSGDTKPILYGIPIDINFENPDIIKLWRDVTND